MKLFLFSLISLVIISAVIAAPGRGSLFCCWPKKKQPEPVVVYQPTPKTPTGSKTGGKTVGNPNGHSGGYSGGHTGGEITVDSIKQTNHIAEKSSIFSFGRFNPNPIAGTSGVNTKKINNKPFLDEDGEIVVFSELPDNSPEPKKKSFDTGKWISSLTNLKAFKNSKSGGNDEKQKLLNHNKDSDSDSDSDNEYSTLFAKNSHTNLKVFKDTKSGGNDEKQKLLNHNRDSDSDSDNEYSILYEKKSQIPQISERKDTVVARGQSSSQSNNQYKTWEEALRASQLPSENPKKISLQKENNDYLDKLLTKSLESEKKDTVVAREQSSSQSNNKHRTWEEALKTSQQILKGSLINP